ncbi:MAG: AMP-binding protein [Alphaproteobacteria bacterium]|nr:AMP-binding protein [Alphaproteobacteria bacterium]
MNVASLLSKAANTFAARPALSVGTRVYSDYSAFAGRVAAMAGALRSTYGLGPGDRVALGMSNCPEFMETLFAAWHAGLCAVPMNAKLHPKEFRYILEHSGSRLCVVTPDKRDAIAPLGDELADLESVIATDRPEYAALPSGTAAAIAEVEPADPCWLFYTSGTTGRPKGAMLSHRNILSMAMNYLADVDAISERDCIIHAAPMSHGSGIYGLPHVARAANQVIPDSGGFDPAEVLELIGHWPGCSFFFAPTMVVRLLASPALDGADLTNLKTLVYGGGPMYVEDCKRALDRLGPKLVQIYGQGEAPMTITWLSRAMHAETDHPRWSERLASVGIPRTDVDVRVVDADDRDVPTGETGEVVARGDVVMTGYWRNPEETAKTLRGGWLHTGDMGSFDEDGFLTLKDRSKDMIISGGSNIYPREVEEVLLQNPAVREVSVIGAPHPDWGEEVVAFVVPETGASIGETDLDRLCLDSIARFKRPKRYRFVDALPKNNYGKVLKTELREMLLREDAEAS